MNWMKEKKIVNGADAEARTVQSHKQRVINVKVSFRNRRNNRQRIKEEKNKSTPGNSTQT